MASPHVPLSRELALPAAYRHVQGYLDRHDPDLRLRPSAERPYLYILERRCRRRPAANVAMRNRSDMHVQARDGYIHVASVHPAFLDKPWNMIEALRTEGEDLWAKSQAGTSAADAITDEQVYEERWARETRRRRRMGLYRGLARDGFDLLNRMGNRDGSERTRIVAPGAPRLPHRRVRKQRNIVASA